MSEALANDIANLIEQCLKKDKEIERLQNIIKEVREYIEQEKYMSVDENCEILAGYNIDELLEILDKENK